MQTYRLLSSPNIYAPGVIAWAINGAAFEQDRPAMIRVICQGWNVPVDAARKLITKQVAFTLEGDTVVFTA